jgi:hypothetical protein
VIVDGGYWFWRWTVILAGLAGLGTGVFLFYEQAYSQDIHQHEGTTSEVDKFYSQWLRPIGNEYNERRTMGCCNKVDCYQARVKNVGGTWFVQQRETGIWRAVPDNIVEQNQPDPEESPDGMAHVCMQASHQAPIIFCFTLGSQG